MFCKKCGNQIDDSSEFCKYCRAKQTDYTVESISTESVSIDGEEPTTIVDKDVDTETEASNNSIKNIPKEGLVGTEKKHVRIKRIIIIMASALFVIALAIVGVICVQNIIVQINIDSIVDDFNDGSIEYDEAIEELRRIDCLNRDSLRRYRDNASTRIDTLNDSKALYDSAVELLNSGDNESAIPLLESIPREDYNYQMAHELLEDARAAYTDNVFWRVDYYISNNDYDLALELLEHAIDIVPKYEDDFRNRISEVESAQEEYNTQSS